MAKDGSVHPVPVEELPLRNPDGSLYVVPPEGSLSLLALGYKGLMAWRAARRKEAARIANTTTDV